MGLLEKLGEAVVMIKNIVEKTESNRVLVQSLLYNEAGTAAPAIRFYVMELMLHYSEKECVRKCEQGDKVIKDLNCSNMLHHWCKGKGQRNFPSVNFEKQLKTCFTVSSQCLKHASWAELKIWWFIRNNEWRWVLTALELLCERLQTARETV